LGDFPDHFGRFFKPFLVTLSVLHISGETNDSVDGIAAKQFKYFRKKWKSFFQQNTLL
jgi:hypothetical protein